MGKVSNIEIVDYKTFSVDLFNANLKSVKIYNYSSSIDISYVKDGQLFGTEKPYGLDSDSVLHSALESKNIEYTILTRKYEGDIKKDEGGYMLYSGLLFMIIPFLLVLVIIIQAITIKRLVSKQKAQLN